MEAKSFINEFNFRKMMVILKAREETRMRDTFTLYAKAGDGGNGYSSFRRSRHDRHGKPDGKWSSHMPVILRQMWMQRAKSVWQLEPCRRSSKSPLTFSSFCSYSDEPQKKAKAAPFQETRMRDRFRLYAKAGDGGNGYSSFRRSRHDRHGEPDGKWSSLMPVILRQMWMQRAKSVWQLEPFRRSSKSPWTFLSFCSCSDEPQKKAKAAPFQETRMRDRFRLYAKAGDGGNGYSSFRRSRHDRHGEPDGFSVFD